MPLLPSKRKGEGYSLTSLQREMNRLFEDFFGRDWSLEPFRGRGGWTPAVDVMETDKEVVVKAELPGMDPKEVEINLAGEALTIRGQKKEEKEEKTRSAHLVERSYGSFERTISLPSAVKADQADAEFKQGILTISLPKTEEAKTRTVKVKVQE